MHAVHNHMHWGIWAHTEFWTFNSPKVVKYGINSIFSKLVFTIILYVFLLHIHLKRGYQSFSSCKFSYKFSIYSITAKKVALTKKERHIFEKLERDES